MNRCLYLVQSDSVDCNSRESVIQHLMTRSEKLRWEQWLNDDLMYQSSICMVCILLLLLTTIFFFLPFSPSLIAFTISSHSVQFLCLLPLNSPPTCSVSWESRGEEGRGNTPTTSKGFSWVVGRWGIFLALWCPFKHSTWRWVGVEGRGCSLCSFFKSLLHIVNFGIHVLFNCLCLNRCLYVSDA